MDRIRRARAHDHSDERPGPGRPRRCRTGGPGGTIALDGSVKQYLPALAAKHPDVANVTIDQLLRMQSGIPDSANVPVTGTPIEQLITDRVVTPLGLSKTVLPAPESTAAPQPQSRGYVTDAQEIEAFGGVVPLGTDVTDWNSWGQAGGGMWSTLQELGTFAASDAGNTLLSKKLAANRLRTKDIGDYTRYGQGIIRFGPWVGHEGEALGYETWALHNTKTGVVYVASANACCGTQALAALAPLIALYPKDGKYFL